MTKMTPAMEKWQERLAAGYTIRRGCGWGSGDTWCGGRRCSTPREVSFRTCGGTR